jgi:heme exporter protein C
VINIPIIYFSVQWWNTLHQGATIRLLNKPTIAGSMQTALWIMLAACWLYSIAIVLYRLRCIILEREQTAANVVATVGSKLSPLPQIGNELASGK